MEPTRTEVTFSESSKVKRNKFNELMMDYFKYDATDEEVMRKDQIMNNPDAHFRFFILSGDMGQDLEVREPA